MSMIRVALSVFTAAAIVLFTQSQARAVVIWSSVTVPNGNFETSGVDTSWTDAGVEGLSGTSTDYGGDVARDILPGWQFAAGTDSRTHMSSGSRTADPVPAGHGQVALIEYAQSTATHRTHISGYITSELIPTVTIPATGGRYMLDVFHYVTGQARGVDFGFIYGAIGTAQFDNRNATAGWSGGDTNNNKWGAPYELNAGLNTRQEGTTPSWVHTRVFWDNTGTSTETFGMSTALVLFNATEGYRGIDFTSVPGVRLIAYYTNLRGTGQGLRLGALAMVNSAGGTGRVYLDGFTLSQEQEDVEAIPEPGTFVLAALGLAGMGLLCLRRCGRRALVRS